VQGGELVVPCNLQPTIVGPISLSRGKLVVQAVEFFALKSRSCATIAREPSQSLTAAALSEHNGVPQGSFGGARTKSYYMATCFEIGSAFYQTKKHQSFGVFIFCKTFLQF